jgi:hypothetical protein
MRFFTHKLKFLLLLLFAQSGFAGVVTYDIGPYRAGGFAASYLHSADGCSGSGQLDLNAGGGRDKLYMCGSRKQAIRGQITGNWDGNRLTNITGNIAGREVLGGNLGGRYYRNTSNGLKPRWNLRLAGLGLFIFERMPINQINAHQLTLWGQNLATYMCDTRRCRDRRGVGIDLYGRARASLPEPGSLGILLAGLMGVGVSLRRRLQTTRGAA